MVDANRGPISPAKRLRNIVLDGQLRPDQLERNDLSIRPDRLEDPCHPALAEQDSTRYRPTTSPGRSSAAASKVRARVTCAAAPDALTERSHRSYLRDPIAHNPIRLRRGSTCGQLDNGASSGLQRPPCTRTSTRLRLAPRACRLIGVRQRRRFGCNTCFSLSLRCAAAEVVPRLRRGEITRRPGTETTRSRVPSSSLSSTRTSIPTTILRRASSK